MNPDPQTSPVPSPEPDWLASVRRHVAELRFGVVQITVHGGKVVQVERTVRFRFESPSNARSTPSHPES